MPQVSCTTDSGFQESALGLLWILPLSGRKNADENGFVRAGTVIPSLPRKVACDSGKMPDS